MIYICRIPNVNRFISRISLMFNNSVKVTNSNNKNGRSHRWISAYYRHYLTYQWILATDIVCEKHFMAPVVSRTLSKFPRNFSVCEYLNLNSEQWVAFFLRWFTFVEQGNRTLKTKRFTWSGNGRYIVTGVRAGHQRNSGLFPRSGNRFFVLSSF
jgi:hypothetical protein